MGWLTEEQLESLNESSRRLQEKIIKESRRPKVETLIDTTNPEGMERYKKAMRALYKADQYEKFIKANNTEDIEFEMIAQN